MRHLSGATRAYLRILKAKNYYLSDPEGVDDDDLSHAVKLSKKAECLVKLVPKSLRRQRQRNKNKNKRIKIRKTIKRTYFKKPPE